MKHKLMCLMGISGEVCVVNKGIEGIERILAVGFLGEITGLGGQREGGLLKLMKVREGATEDINKGGRSFGS